MQVIFFYTKFGNFDILHAFLPLNVAKLLTLTNSPFFGQPCICLFNDVLYFMSRVRLM